MRIERGLAVAVAGLTAGAVVGAEIGLFRELLLERAAGWLCITGIVLVAAVATRYGRWLVPHLRRVDEPHWRLSPRESRRLLPATAFVFWTAGAFASYTSPWDWAISTVAAAGMAVIVVPYVLQRLDERSAPPQSTRSGDHR